MFRGSYENERVVWYMYELDCMIKSFAVANDCVSSLNKVCYSMGKELKPFCLFADEFQSKYGVSDLAMFGGFEHNDLVFAEDVARYRMGVLDLDSELTPDLCKVLFYQYLMTISVCYVEVEKWKTTSGVSHPTYDKFLCTRNPAIMAAWMGSSTAEMQQKYSNKVVTSNFELAQGITRYVKLNTSAKGNSITCPRSFASVEKMKCIPLFMINAWFTGVKGVLNDNIVRFTFLKDNHTERELCSTLSDDIIRRYYNDNNFINTMLSCVDIDQNEQGGLHLSSKINRGYVKVPELGASIYDSTGTRSLNLARILKAEIVDSIDTTFINVSLGSVVQNFCEAVEYCNTKTPDYIPSIYSELLKQETGGKVNASLINEMEDYVRSKEILLSTQFQRDIHMFLISHPDWFPLYTGVENRGASSFEEYGVAPMDF